MGNLFAGPHLWIILIIIVLLFGAAKLPALAKSLGQSARLFKGEMKALKEDDAPAATSDAPDVPTVKPVQPTTSRPADQDTPPRSS
ncbi:twin-arginine translocase TatA/TatE family subunit [Microbacterium sp. A94]|uniref:twin-arginine translocase TatA/TatE family subunit n=1 Tax=Microbacterium sp. A94 TaxID=3450717 RepID=UPI003F427E99